MNEYYYMDGKDQQGPFTIEELKEKAISKETYVWYEGIENWKKAGEVDQLKEIFTTPIIKTIPPPFTTPPTFIDKVEKCNKCGNELTDVYEHGQKIDISLCLKCDITEGICPFCKSQLRTKQAQQCSKCGRSWHKERVDMTVPVKRYESKYSSTKNEDSIKCPKCKSTQLTSNKKGYSIAKGAAGLLIPGGVLWGLHGRNKIKITCLKCGHSWDAGK